MINNLKKLKDPYYRRINKIEILNSGIDEKDGYAFVQLKDFKFYGKDKESILMNISKRYLSPGKINDKIACAKYYDVDNKVCLELGAFVGYYAMRISRKAKLVIAVEPIKENFEILSKNIEANEIKNIIPINCAVWNTNGQVELEVDSNQKNSITKGIISKKKIESVTSKNIDTIISENVPESYGKVGFVRIQINGAEMEALGGMEKTFNDNPDLVVSAIYKDKYKEVQKFLDDKEYKTENKKGTIWAVK